ncbi:MAG: translation initiation factor IF-2 [Candidatus Aenigmatarchaeota archaeon]|nr:MAG: translation initiation factor IF-2 [Candidatus Aenigmarchaeota archaeon]
MKNIRSPIIAILGHVDHGKTTLLDKIRGTAIASSEAGGITQAIGATHIPISTIKKICGRLLEKMKIKLIIPSLLFIDTPGHEAFTTLRKRGGAVADIAVLVIDINEGFRPQTEESINFLKQFRTPFVVAATKIDRITGWHSEERCFLESFPEQTERAQEEMETKLYNLIGQLKLHGFDAERYDRVRDYTRQVAVVPVSGITGEGIPDLLMVLAGISQKFLKDNLEVQPGEGKGTVLEVKEYRGLGVTIDVVIYDGEIRRGDYLIIGGSTPETTVITRVKALLKPNPLSEMRVEKNFISTERVSAAAGVKIAAPGLENVIAGSPLRAVSDKSMIDKAVKEVKEEIEEVEIETDHTGFILKADTLGSLEALIKSLKSMNMPIRKAHVGTITKTDILEAKTMEKPLIFAFGVAPSDEIKKLARDNNVKIFSSDVIYKLIEDYNKWEEEKRKLKEEELLEKTTRPGRVRIMRGCIFRRSRPAIFGVEVIKGTIKPGYRLTKNGKIIGEIKEIQSRGENTGEAHTADKVALSMEDVVIGEHINEGDILEVFLTDRDKTNLEKIRSKLSEDEKELLDEEQ